MLRLSPYRWFAVSSFTVIAISAAAYGCATVSPAPAPVVQTGVRISSAQQSRAGVGVRGRSARVENPADMLKVQPQRTESTLEEWLAPADRPTQNNGLCPSDMATIDDRYCIDRYEGSLVEILPNGDERSWDANQGVEGHTVRAINRPGVLPQGYISAQQAERACRNAGKRLCSPNEWRKACKGPQHLTYGYSNTNQERRCNDHGKSPMLAHFGLSGMKQDAAKWTIQKMNDPALNQVEGTLAASGSHPGCTNGYGVYDMVGNLHEWTNDPEGTFLGGYYLDIHQNGDGCDYGTYAHAVWYHDYSTGFRCCADVAQ